VSKRKISAKEAVADIRSGMTDSDLMKKYNLPPEGLQSLFDKLVNAGIIDLAEMQSRLTGFLGTVVISESDIPRPNGNGSDSLRSPDPKSPPRIHAQQAARDIRLGMSDFALMEKYRLSARGLQSLFEKLVSRGLLTQDHLVRRDLGIDDTVDLREEMLSLSGALRYYGAIVPTPSAGDTGHAPEPLETSKLDNEPLRTVSSPGENHDNNEVQEATENAGNAGMRWYNKPLFVVLSLICFFPLGFYALNRNSTLSGRNKMFMTITWLALAVLCLLVVSLELDWGRLAG
jgi:hypothetical protein